MIWELNKPVPPNRTTMDSDAGIFLRREVPNAAGGDGEIADIMMHCYQIPFCLNTSRYATPYPLHPTSLPNPSPSLPHFSPYTPPY